MTSLYVMMYQPDNHVLKIKDPIYKPLQCGKTLYKDNGSKEFLPELGDDTGENISKLNELYSELTGTYWIWKNVKNDPDDIVGVVHYRRYFAEPEDLNKPISEKTLKKLLEDTDYLVNGYGTDFDPTQPGDEMIYEQYSRMHIKEDIDMAIKAVYDLYGIYLGNKFEHEIKYSGAMCCNNMLICKRKYFDKYCEFLFPVLEYIRERTDFAQDKYQGYQRRAFGFLSERLTRPFMKAYGYKSKQNPELNWEKYSGYKWQ